MKYAPDPADKAPGRYNISILGDNYYVVVPEKELVITGKKQGKRIKVTRLSTGKSG